MLKTHSQLLLREFAVALSTLLLQLWLPVVLLLLLLLLLWPPDQHLLRTSGRCVTVLLRLKHCSKPFISIVEVHCVHC